MSDPLTYPDGPEPDICCRCEERDGTTYDLPSGKWWCSVCLADADYQQTQTTIDIDPGRIQQWQDAAAQAARRTR